MIAWILVGTLYVLGAGLCTATPSAKKEHGWVLLVVLLLWPVAALLGLVAIPGVLLWNKELARSMVAANEGAERD